MRQSYSVRRRGVDCDDRGVRRDCGGVRATLSASVAAGWVATTAVLAGAAVV